MRCAMLIGAGAIALLATGAWGGETAAGHPYVIDGDTLRLSGQVIGLYGIAAPARTQTCEGRGGRRIPCGLDAAHALAGRIGEGSVACEPRGLDRHGRSVALCRLGGEDLGAWMVARGHAVADRTSTADYVDLETRAWGRRTGLWAGVFEDPATRRREAIAGLTRLSALRP